MNVKDLVEKLDFQLVTQEHDTIDKEITGLYYGDLLSWVMSHAKQGNAWITVQTHANTIAVATLIEMSCIIIPESIEIDTDTIHKANEENIPILSTHLNCYEIFCKIYELGFK
jgi:serine kinase of HPr protein (carbohydrate metabolism regulator)